MPKAGWKKNPATGKYEAPAVDAVRHDPDDAPIDGDYSKDQVLNKDPSKTYALVHADDMPTMKGRGYVPTVRQEGSARPVFDQGGDGNFMVDNLLLMEVPKERAERVQAAAERRGAARWQSQQQAFNAGHADRDVINRTEKNDHVQNARTWS